MNFYPRSPCGERQSALQKSYLLPSFLSTLSLRRATLFDFPVVPVELTFLSTLSLRRATFIILLSFYAFSNFYPRSPCGERRVGNTTEREDTQYFYPRSPCGERLSSADCSTASSIISIHALLAESDTGKHLKVVQIDISIHALLAESDSNILKTSQYSMYFYPRSPCGERPPSANVRSSP